MIQGKGKNLSFEIKTKASVTGVTAGTQLYEVRGNTRIPKAAVWALVWALTPSQGGKDPKIPFNPAQRLLHPLPGLGSWRRTTARAAAPKARPSPCPAPAPFLLPAASDSDSWDLPRGLSWEFSRAGSREDAQAVKNLDLLQPRVWGMSSIPHVWAVFLGAARTRADPMGILFLILTSSLQELQDRQPWFPGS